MAVKSIDLATTACQLLLDYRVPIRPAIGISGTPDGLSVPSPYSRFARVSAVLSDIVVDRLVGRHPRAHYRRQPAAVVIT